MYILINNYGYSIFFLYHFFYLSTCFCLFYYLFVSTCTYSNSRGIKFLFYIFFTFSLGTNIALVETFIAKQYLFAFFSPLITNLWKYFGVYEMSRLENVKCPSRKCLNLEFLRIKNFYKFFSVYENSFSV